MAMVILSVSVWGSACQSVFAQESDSQENNKKSIWEQLRKAPAFLVAQMGSMLNGDFEQMLANDKAFTDWINGIEADENQDTIIINNNGTVTLSQEGVEQLQTILDDFLASNTELLDVIWSPVITEKNLRASWFHTIESYGKTMSLFNTHDLIGLYRHENLQAGSLFLDLGYRFDDNGNLSTDVSKEVIYTPVYVDLSDVSFHFNSAAFSDTIVNGFSYLTTTFGHDTTTNPARNVYTYFVDRTGINTSPAWYWHNGNKWTLSTDTGAYGTFKQKPFRGVYNPFFVYQLPSTGNNFNYFIPVASSKSEIGYIPIFRNANAYKDWVTGNGTYYRFNSGYTGGDLTFNPNADYGKLQDAIKDAVSQGVADGADMSALLSRMQTVFSQTLNEINGTLGDIEDNTNTANLWLEKIYNKLVDIDKHVKGILTATAVDTAVNALSDFWNAITDWIDGVLDLLDIVTQAADIGNILKTKFPFSIPWDVYGILAMLYAPAKTPVLRLHFQFPMFDDWELDYEYIMDDQAWANFAFVCRFFLTINYEISLLHLTQKLYASGLFDIPMPKSRKK